MAQPGVAREPSMEEILASIRRIIESNEPGVVSGAPQSLPPVYDEEEIEESFDVAATPVAAAVGAYSQQGRFERAVEQVSPPARVPPPANQSFEGGADRPLSLADVAARVRAASVRAGTGYEDAAPAHAEPAPAAIPAVPSVRAEIRPVAAIAPELTGVELRGTHALAPPELPVEPAHGNAVTDSRAAASLESLIGGEAIKPAEQRESVASSVPATISNLLSSEAGQQVARSFSELAAVFDGVERRSMEDMAAEMLQPMLKEWLDDNLPTLVERLVREEIERVARSPRR